MKHEYRGFTIEFVQEEDALNPRTEWDNVATMVCFHKRYNLGDEGHGVKSSDYSSWDELEKALFAKYDIVAIRPMYMYDHSGITVRTTPYECPWDSGQIGFVFVTKQKLFEATGKKRMSEKLRDEAVKFIASDVELYDNYLTGAVYRYIIEDPDGEKIENGSVGGWYGADPGVIGVEGHATKEAKETIDHEIEERKRAANPENHPDQMALGLVEVE